MKVELTEDQLLDCIEAVEQELMQWRKSSLHAHVPNTITSLSSTLDVLVEAKNAHLE